MLPNESLLQVLHFVDYKTLVLAKLAGAPLLRVATKYAEELARRRSYQVDFYTRYISYVDEAVDEHPKQIRFAAFNQASLTAACRELEGVIGRHAVATLFFNPDALCTDGVIAVFEAAPALKYAEDVDLSWPGNSTTSPEDFLQNFAGMKALRLSLLHDAIRQMNWTFLRKESAREMRLLEVSGYGPAPTGSVNDSVEKLVRCWVTLPRL
ncbi:hypothetical protein AAVH_24167 [Aphelenchoides avenae]|nr:hypothetical protein AAVH_24167 [Aphelenchus avenae]